MLTVLDPGRGVGRELSEPVLALIEAPRPPVRAVRLEQVTISVKPASSRLRLLFFWLLFFLLHSGNNFSHTENLFGFLTANGS
jgi:hypothetical protein